MPNPRHIALIPDGNRRWAKERGLPGFAGHQAGAKATEAIFASALDLKIPFVTFWGCSISNLTNRDPKEVSFLISLFAKYFRELTASDQVNKNKIHITALGRWRDYFTADAIEATEQMIEKTKDYDGLHLTFLLGYSGTEEMTQAVQALIKKSPIIVSEEAIKNELYTRDLPPVDLVIRTGGEPHLSAGFMMWDTADSQIYFTDTFWPAFSPEEFKKAIDTFSATERRHGR
jgi:undecaprenyl diphosphate synthase